MQNAYNTAKTMFVQPSLRPEIDIHSLDYHFPKTKTRPVVRKADDATKHAVMPGKPAVAQGALSAQSTITAPSYKTVSLPVAKDRQQSTTAGETTAVLSTEKNFRYTAETFVDAARSGDLEAVQRHIDAGLDVNVGTLPHEATPLMYAAGSGHEAIVRQLLKVGASVDQADIIGATALMCATRSGHTVIVQALLNRGAKIDQANINGETALICGAHDGHTGSVQALLDRGAPVDQPRTGGWTALIYASQNSHTATVRLLLARGATVDQADINGASALMFAAKNGHMAIVLLLLKGGANGKLNTKRGNTALDFAIHHDKKEVIKLLRAHKAPTNHQPKGYFHNWFG